MSQEGNTSSSTPSGSLELALSLKHLEHHILQNDLNTKRISKIQQRILSKENIVSSKGAAKIYQAYETLLQDINNHLQALEHSINLCHVPKAEVVQAVTDDSDHSGSKESVSSEANSEKSSSNEDLKLADEKDTTVAVENPVVGSLVAALTITNSGFLQSQEWVLAKVTSINPVTNYYHVEDVDFEVDQVQENITTQEYDVPGDRVITVPVDEETALRRPEFKLKQQVLALFPSTTCFYPCVVVSNPSRRRKTRDYLVKFSDDDVPHRPCPARFVLPFKG